MPTYLSILRFLARELLPDTCLNLMPQYHPAGKVNAKNSAR